MGQAPGETGRKNTAIWVLAGCGAGLMALLCVGTGVATFFVMRSDGVASDRTADGDDPTAPKERGPSPTVQTPDRDESAPWVVVAKVTAATGTKPVDEGAQCGFAVERHPSPGGGYWCRSQIVCAGKLLYGGPRSGYFQCTVVTSGRLSIVGSDVETSAKDTDAAMTLNTVLGELSLRDDSSGAHGAYTLSARIISVR